MMPGEKAPVSEIIRVLVIEDNPDDGRLLLRQLQKINFAEAVKVIPDGLEAWNVMSSKDGCLDLIAIFLDLKLPSLSGVELLGRIRSHADLRDIPVFVMTSTDDSRTLEECARLGVKVYLPKPITYSVFSSAMANLFHAPRLDGQASVG
jgi:CheY-like chemotaxis protein